MKNTAIYARVSTRVQEPETQLKDLRTYARRRRLKVVAELVDKESGAKVSRPQLDKLMALARRRVMRIVLMSLAFATACFSQAETGAEEQLSRFALLDTISADVAIVFAETTYVHGVVATVTVHNNTDREIIYHLGCQSVVEGDDGEIWRTVYRLDCSLMRIRPTRLGVGETSEERYTIPAAEELSRDDSLRFRLRMDMDSESYFSPPFGIVPQE